MSGRDHLLWQHLVRLDVHVPNGVTKGSRVYVRHGKADDVLPLVQVDANDGRFWRGEIYTTYNAGKFVAFIKGADQVEHYDDVKKKSADWGKGGSPSGGASKTPSPGSTGPGSPALSRTRERSNSTLSSLMASVHNLLPSPSLSRASSASAPLDRSSYPKEPVFVLLEWLWGNRAPVLRRVCEEPRQMPPDTCHAIICYPDPHCDALADAPPVMAGAAPKGRGVPTGGRSADEVVDAVGRGRGRGQRGASLGPPTGRGRGRGVDARGAEGNDAAPLAESPKQLASSAPDELTPAAAPASPSVARKQVKMVSPAHLALDKLVELRNSFPNEKHFIICPLGIHDAVADSTPLGVAMQRRIVQLAKEKGVFGVGPDNVIAETSSFRETNCFFNIKYHLTRAGVAKVILVSYEHDVERLLLLWTSVMQGQKIGIATVPVETSGTDAEKAELRAAAQKKAADVADELRRLAVP